MKAPHFSARVFAALLLVLAIPAVAAEPAVRWWKGNLHTHSLWSDGNDYPEMIAAWYKDRGYHFLALSDHNVLSDHALWIPTKKAGQPALEKYLARWGEKWVERRTEEGEERVRLKMLSEFRVPLEEPGRFLMVQSEEITAPTVHINATNLRERILPYTANTSDSAGVVQAMQRTVSAVLEQRKRTGVPMFPHINHPNFKWAITAEELMQVEGERFFEVYNGHPLVHNEGDELHAGTERVWDIILTERLAVLGKEPMFGLATDDSHNYHDEPKKLSHPGRGWVMVRAAKLEIGSLIEAMEAGDFYASSGVTLRDVRREKDRLAVEIEPEAGVTYTTEFIGTRRGYDASRQPVTDDTGAPLRVTQRYSKDIGVVLAKVEGTSAVYSLKGDEIYVRACVTSSKHKTDPARDGEFERAWTQPLVLGKPSGERDGATR
jgi:hypothetical protein